VSAPSDDPRDSQPQNRPLPPVLVQPIKQVKRARRLRKEMSLPAVLLWIELQKRPGGFKFRREFPSHPYTLDFACLSARVGIEVDGAAHDCGDQPALDEARDRVMAERGFRMLRILATEVLKNMEGCVMGIVAVCEEQTLLNPPRHGEVPRRGGGGPALRGHSAGRRAGTPPSASRPPPRSGEDLA
jgi:very-short-patch-repair endonuclease